MTNLILDVGCGHRKHIDRKRGNIGIDLYKGKCDIVADAHYLPFTDKTFTITYFFDVIEHVYNPFQCLNEIYRVLKDNGIVKISTPNVLHWRKFFRIARGKTLSLSDTAHIIAWTEIEMKNLLWNTNFSNIKIFYTILEATKQYDSKKHVFIDTLIQKLLPSFCNGITGRSMIIEGLKQ